MKPNEVLAIQAAKALKDAKTGLHRAGIIYEAIDKAVLAERDIVEEVAKNGVELAVLVAVQLERKRCAEIADEIFDLYGSVHDSVAARAASRTIAVKIRKVVL